MMGRKTRVLDMPCGFGRNTKYLASKYESVIAGDYDPDVVSGQWYSRFPNVYPVRLDGRGELPFRDECFDMVTVVHFYDASLPLNVWRVLKPGGVLFLESVGNRGENWRELPLRADLAALLDQGYEPIIYKLNMVSKSPDHATFKVLARRKRCLRNFPSGAKDEFDVIDEL